MKPYLIALFLPPFAVCRYGCAGGCCAAPVGVFWLTAILGMVYGWFGGPLGHEGISWGTVGLGALLYGISVAWAWLTLRQAAEDRCPPVEGVQPRSGVVCKVMPGLDEPDPFDEVRKARS